MREEGVMTTQEVPVAGSWWTAGFGWVFSIIEWLVAGMSPLAALVAIATLVLTVIKIAQEIRAYRNKGLEQTALRKLVDKLTRRSGFGESR
jgi:hypothetical protein